MKSLVVLYFLLAATAAAGTNVPLKSPLLRIAGGQTAQPKQFPYQARLEITKFKQGIFDVTLCGGALISNSTILTAAHCLQNAISAIIYLGVTKNSRERSRVIRLSSSLLKHFKQHENYNDTTLENDIALIKLTPLVHFNKAVKTVNLPTDSKMKLENRMAVIAGFGKTSENSTASSELLYANRKILPAPDCQQYFPDFFTPKMHICTDGSEYISVCSGDSGGPLVVDESDGSKTVVGLTSYGLLACELGYPGVFTKVPNYLVWIEKNKF